MPIPSSTLPGHQVLHESVVAALERCVETRALDFKEAAPWNALQYKLIRTLLAMANLSDGGIVVVGVSQRDDSWELQGVSHDILATYDVDLIISAVNNFSSPPIEPEIVTVEHQGLLFLAFRIEEFTETPVVCRRTGPETSGLKEGTAYVRPPGLARTTQVTRADELHDLLEVAAEKRARRILEVSRRIGMTFPASDLDQFDKELEGL